MSQPSPPQYTSDKTLSSSPSSSPTLHPTILAPPLSTTTPNPDAAVPDADAGTSGARRRGVRPATTTLERNSSDSEQQPQPQPGVPRRQTAESARSRRTTNSNEPNAGILRRMTTGLFTPEKKVGKAPTYIASLKAAILSTWLNVLLVFIPVGWVLYLVKHAGGNDSISDTAVFITTFIAIIPLAGLLGFATEEAALRLGQTLGGLLNATLGNAVELIVAILALVKCELAVVQSSLVGSILSNILLVLGMCFFAGGVRFAEQTIKTTAAQLNSSLLLIAVIAVLIPSAFHFSIDSSDTSNEQLAAGEGADLLSMSHAVAIILLVLYLGYLVFQMWSHAALYNDDLNIPSTQYADNVTANVARVSEKMRFHRKKHDDLSSSVSASNEETIPNGVRNATPSQAENGAVRSEDEEEEEEQPQMNIPSTIILMVLITVVVGFTAEFLVASINGLVEAHPSLSAEWVGLILLPIVGNAAEHFTAVSVSVKDKIDLSISVAVGSSIQIALFVIPVIELLAWTIGKPLTLLFDPYESIVLFLSVLIVNQTLSDGRSNWMEGMILMFLYLIIAVTFWYYPGSNTATLLGCASTGSNVVG